MKAKPQIVVSPEIFRQFYNEALLYVAPDGMAEYRGFPFRSDPKLKQVDMKSELSRIDGVLADYYEGCNRIG